MNSVPYLWVYILFATVLIPSLLLFGIAVSLKSAGIPDKRIRGIVLSAGTLLFSWMALDMLLGWLGVFRSGGKVPFIAFGICIPIVIGIWLIRRSATVREILRAVSQRSIVGVQGYRGLGAIFLVLYGQRLLPEVFALPAGFGDVMVGFAALLVAAIYASGWSNRGWLVAAWNVFGIVDFVIAIATGFLTSPGPWQRFSFAQPNTLVGAYPLVMIPVFAVPLSVFLHIGSLTKLIWGEEWKVSSPSGNWATGLSTASSN
jgi:hypothetical protein